MRRTSQNATRSIVTSGTRVGDLAGRSVGATDAAATGAGDTPGHGAAVRLPGLRDEVVRPRGHGPRRGADPLRRLRRPPREARRGAGRAAPAPPALGSRRRPDVRAAATAD